MVLKLDWKISATAILINCLISIGWAFKADARIQALEQWSNQNNQLLERMKGVEVRVETLKEQSTRIESKLDRLVE